MSRVRPPEAKDPAALPSSSRVAPDRPAPRRPGAGDGPPSPGSRQPTATDGSTRDAESGQDVYADRVPCLAEVEQSACGRLPGG
ncbi:hypothetical protein ACIO8H_35195 [Streptomyces sp. NPDC087226]|uniref:hypothetical protein n=1 Tax=Streptomyces sp. NPDC087226 TaxID=3365771 RepID=UPI0038263378